MPEKLTLLKHNTDRVPKRSGYNPSVCQPTRTRQHKQLSCVVGQGWPCLKTGKRLNLPDKEESTATALTPFLVCVQPPPPPRTKSYPISEGAAIHRPIVSYPGFSNAPQKEGSLCPA